MIVDQFLSDFQNPEIELGAEFIGTAANLLWLKSKRLLPKHEQLEGEDDEGPDPHFDVIHQLIDYCHFKQMGQKLVVLEKEQHAYFPRGVAGNAEVKKPLGIDHLSVDDIALLFSEALQRAKTQSGVVHEEQFRISDKIRELKQKLGSGQQTLFTEIFSPEKTKMELIVTFLAVLELMKSGDLAVVRLPDSDAIIITKQNPVGECA